MIPIFKGKISDEKLQILNRGMWREHLKSFKPGMLVEVIVRKPKRVVSNPLRKYYYAVVAKMIADFTGHSVDAIHEAMKHKFVSYEDPATGLTMTKSVFSNESDMDIDEKKAFILNVRSWASEYLELLIPEPEDVNF